jgi:hypothetical protein
MSSKNASDVKVTIYDLDNKPHLMTHLNARDMITHCGWSLVPVDKKAVASGEALLAEALAAATSANADLTAIQKELNGLSKAEMISLALERYATKIDGRKSEQVIIAVILELETEAQSKGASQAAAYTPEETEQTAETTAATETPAEEETETVDIDDDQTAAAE